MYICYIYIYIYIYYIMDHVNTVRNHITVLLESSLTSLLDPFDRLSVGMLVFPSVGQSFVISSKVR